MSEMAMDTPVLVTIPGVELVSVGEWDAVTGPVTFTTEDLQAAVAALADPAVHAPRLRIGHTDSDVTATASAGGFSDQPAFGRFVNLRLNDTGTSIVADMAGVPAWLAAILPSAFPSRSIEAYFDVTTASGRKHDMVITSVALLGVSMPAVETLDDLRLAYGAEVPDGVELEFVTGDRVAATREGAMGNRRVSASTSYEDVRRSFFEDFATEESGRYWWWPIQVMLSPPVAIADDDEGGLWSVPFSIKGDTVKWADPTEVKVQYVEVESGKVAAARASAAHTYATATEARPKDRVRAATATDKEETMGTIPTAILERLELPEDATEEQALAKLAEIQAETPPTDGGEEGGDEEDETSQQDAREPIAASGKTIDEVRLAQLEEDARLGREARQEQIAATQTAYVDAAIKAGKFPPARRHHYLLLMEKDEQGTREFVDELTAGAIPVEERGVATLDQPTAIRTQVSAGLAAAGVKTREEQ